MLRYLGLVGLIALVGCGGSPPSQKPAADPVAAAQSEGVGTAYTLLVPHMT